MTHEIGATWNDRLKKAIANNKRDAHNRYLQLATVTASGEPRVRMVVFRGFANAGMSLLIITDTRSQKIAELAQQNTVEVAWYFTRSREQFRLRCSAAVHTADDDPTAHRGALWVSLSEAAKSQFFWRRPGALRHEGETLPVTEDPPSTFSVVELTPFYVDHLTLAKTQTRVISESSDGRWCDVNVNP